MNISHDYKIIRNIQVLQWLCKGSLGPFLAIYFTQVSGEEFAAVGIFSLLLLSTSIFEIPTGSLADKHGRLKVFLISQIFFFISLFFLHTTNGFILLGWAILSGLSEAIASGTSQTWFIDRHKDNAQLRTYIARCRSVSLAAMAFSALISGMILYFTSDLVWIIFVCQFSSALLIMYVCFNLKLDSKGIGKIRTHTQQISYSFNSLWNNKLLRWYWLSSMISTLCLFPFINFWQLSLYNEAKDINSYLVVSVVTMLSLLIQGLGNSITSWIKSSNPKSNIYLITISSSAISIGVILCGLTNNIYIYILSLLPIFVFVGLRNAPVQILLNNEITSDTRSTVTSIFSLTSSFVGSLFGFFLSYLLIWISIKQAWLVFGLVYLSFTLINFIMLRYYLIINQQHKPLSSNI